MTNKKNKNIELTELHTKPELPSPWIDTFNISIRSDDVVIVRFFTDLPEGKFEQSRIITSKNRLKAFMDMLCSTMDHYPIPKKNDTKTKTKK